MEIIIIDTGMANVGSVSNMIRYLGFQCTVSNDINLIKNADKLILPGVGSFDEGMLALKNSHLLDCLIEEVITNRKPILGICLGMQLMTKGSEEGKIPGLGWFDAETKKFDSTYLGQKRIVPHMGWNSVKASKHLELFDGFENSSKFYFVHSYYVDAYNSSEILCTTEYGEKFVSGLNKDNIFGVQFHPEKSHRYGMNLLKSFIELEC